MRNPLRGRWTGRAEDRLSWFDRRNDGGPVQRTSTVGNRGSAHDLGHALLCLPLVMRLESGVVGRQSGRGERKRYLWRARTYLFPLGYQILGPFFKVLTLRGIHGVFRMA